MGSRKGVGLIKCSDFQRLLLACSISDPSVLTTRGAYVFIFSLCCLLFVCNVFTTPRAGHQSRPLPLVCCLYVTFLLPLEPHTIGQTWSGPIKSWPSLFLLRSFFYDNNLTKLIFLPCSKAKELV